MILECDIGNTRCKWRLLEDGQVIDRGLAEVGQDFAGMPVDSQIQRVRVACVAGEAVEQRLQSWIGGQLGLECEFARSSARAAGLENSYDQPDNMGVDRWLAAVAAWHEYESAVLVIDLGSALNAELVDADGRHLGGYIIPGADLMQKSLLEGTGRVRFDEELPFALMPGRSTAGTVSNGISLALLGAIREIIAQAGQNLPAGFNIVLTGGGAEYVRPYLPEAVAWRPDLVMEGLGWLLP